MHTLSLTVAFWDVRVEMGRQRMSPCSLSSINPVHFQFLIFLLLFYIFLCNLKFVSKKGYVLLFFLTLFSHIPCASRNFVAESSLYGFGRTSRYSRIGRGLFGE